MEEKNFRSECRCFKICEFFSLFVTHWLRGNRIRKALENRTNMEDDRVAVLEQQLAQAKLIAEEADKKYEEVANSYSLHSPAHAHAMGWVCVCDQGSWPSLAN